jgi:hypothetical protein
MLEIIAAIIGGLIGWSAARWTAQDSRAWAARAKAIDTLAPILHAEPTTAAEVKELRDRWGPVGLIIDLTDASNDVGKEVHELGLKYLDGLDGIVANTMTRQELAALRTKTWRGVADLLRTSPNRQVD